MSKNFTNSASKDVQGVPLEPISVSVPNAAALIGVCSKSMYNLVAAGRVPSFKFGSKILIPVDGLRDWANRQVIAR